MVGEFLTTRNLSSGRFFRLSFPNGSFMSGKLGARPSATWRGLCAARFLLEEGSRRRIGNGESTNIWTDAWLKDNGNFRVITTRSTNSVFPDRVSDFIDVDSRSWRWDILEQYFRPVDRERILKIPIGDISTVDRLVWHYSPHGEYTVRSGYHLALNISSHSTNQTGGVIAGSGSGYSGASWK